jgi:hypothetical protein
MVSITSTRKARLSWTQECGAGFVRERPKPEEEARHRGTVLLGYPEMQERPKKVAVVFDGRPAEADLIRFILKEAGIGCWLDAEPGSGPLQPVRILVAPEDAERAKAEIKRSREDETAAD